jgi:peptidoglycan DL-endopeptidase LytF
LKQYSQPDPLQTTTSPATTESAPLAAQTAPGASDVIPLPAAPPSNFVDDLQAITQSPAAVTSAAAASEEKSYIEVKVKKGDVLEKIARHHHSSVAEIMKLNNLHSTNLKIGQVLKIPSKSPTIAKAPSQTAAPASSTDGGSVKYYTVKPGDNPWTIAVKNHMKVEDLLKLNNMDEGKAKKLKPGDQIRIR